MASLVNGLGAHASGVTAGIGLGEAEASDLLGGGELGNQAIFEGLVSVLVNGIHNETGLDREGRTIA